MDWFTRFTLASATLFFGAGVIIIACMLFSLPAYLLWNWLMPTLFGFPTLTIWQTFGLMILCKILFGNTYFRKEDYEK